MLEGNAGLAIRSRPLSGKSLQSKVGFSFEVRGSAVDASSDVHPIGRGPGITQDFTLQEREALGAWRLGRKSSLTPLLRGRYKSSARKLWVDA